MSTTKPVEWTDDQKACIDALAVFAKSHHHLRNLRPFGDGVSILWRSGDLATHDAGDLTRLVLVAHAFAIRIHIQQGAPGTVKIVAFRCCHGDRAAMNFWEYHPSLSELRETVSKWIDELNSYEDQP